MSPRRAPDLDLRREEFTHAARTLAESESWSAVTMRRLSGELGITQPVLYSAFAGRQALVDAVAVSGFDDLAAELVTSETTSVARMRAYLEFAASNPRTYEAMFSMPTDLAFATPDAPEPLRRAFAAIAEVFPSEDGARAELAWATLHGLATLEAGGRLRDDLRAARLELARRALSGPVV